MSETICVCGAFESGKSHRPTCPYGGLPREPAGWRVIERAADGFLFESADRDADGLKRRKRAKKPTMKRLEKMVYDGIATCPDGCRTEPDGGCPHGFKSWLLILGIC